LDILKFPSTCTLALPIFRGCHSYIKKQIKRRVDVV
jgi:hypothetical protein